MGFQDVIDMISAEVLKLELNSLTLKNEQGSKEFIVNIDTGEINNLISPKEYVDEESFINKLQRRLPLMKRTSENKEKLEEDDFYYY